MVYRKRRKRIVYTTPENKIKAVERVLLEKIPTRQVAEEIDVSQTSIQQWVKQYKDYGPQHFFKNKKNLEKYPVTMIDEQELKRLKEIEKAYEEQKVQVEILKKFQTFLKQK